MCVLYNVELIRKVCYTMAAEAAAEKRGTLLERARNYERGAVIQFASIATAINDASASGDFQLTEVSENKLPLISHHANTGLVVLALEKAIEHTISYAMSLTKSSTLEDAGNAARTSPLPLLPEAWMESIRHLFVCLSTLDRTISGQCLARPALQELIYKYSDVILDCWYDTPEV
jgi:hypothetical protein